MEHESKSIEIIREMRSVIAEAEAIGPWIDGHLLKNKRSTSRRTAAFYYPTLPISSTGGREAPVEAHTAGAGCGDRAADPGRRAVQGADGPLHGAGRQAVAGRKKKRT